jgi:beta-lactam-binding protein with PASTA domain
MPGRSTTPKHHQSPPHHGWPLRPVAIAAPTTTTLPPATTAAPTTTPKVEVPELVGLKLASAKQRLATKGLKLRVRYRPTARFAAGTVISQSRRIGVGVAPSSAITLVIAKALPPPPTTQPPPPQTTPDRGSPGVWTTRSAGWAACVASSDVFPSI